MEQKTLLERSAANAGELDGRATQNSQPLQVSAEEEAAPEVLELAGQVREALTPVKAPASVRDRLRDEVVEVAQRRLCQDVRVESPPRRREWAIGAAIGSAVALIGGVLYLLRSRMQGPSKPDSRSQSRQQRGTQ